MTWTYEQARWLVNEAGRGWLLRMADESYDPMRMLTTLRKNLTAAQASAVVEQLALRRRAQAKFAHAGEMFLTRKSCEQATDEAVAHYKSLRYSRGAPWLDLCCGIGGDCLALGGRACGVAVDNDRVAALFAQSNAQQLAAGKVQVVAGRAENFDLQRFAAWHIDPDRRAEGLRTTRVEHFSPAAAELAKLIEQNKNAAVKLAPATELPSEWPTEVEREWIGRAGECRQQMAWFGGLTTSLGQRRATMVDRQGQVLRSVAGALACELPVSEVGLYIYEPDAAVIAARLVGQLATESKLAAVSPGVAYLTGDHLCSDPAVTAFRVQEVMPLDLKRLKAYFKSRQVGRVEVKSRDNRIEANKLAQQLASKGCERATLLVYPTRAGTRAVVAERVT
jgi:hypothetical protein